MRRLFVKKNDFFDERVSLEGQLIEIVRPGLRRLVSQSAGEGQVPFLQCKRSGSGMPITAPREISRASCQPPDMPRRRRNEISDRPQSVMRLSDIERHGTGESTHSEPSESFTMAHAGSEHDSHVADGRTVDDPLHSAQIPEIRAYAFRSMKFRRALGREGRCDTRHLVR